MNALPDLPFDTSTASLFALPSRIPPIVFAGLGDGFNDYPGRQLLLHAIAAYTPVIFLRWARGRKGRLSRPILTQVGENLFDTQGVFTLRTSRLRCVGSAAGLLDAMMLRSALRELGFNEFIYWLAVGDPVLTWSMPKSRMIYDCVDPCFLPERQAIFNRNELCVVRKARMVFCTAHSLYERIKPIAKICHLLPNACSEESYLVGLKRSIDDELPLALRGRRRPFVGYMGTVDWRFDVESVIAAAKQRPDATFVVVGRINIDQQERVSKLCLLPNVVVVGSVSREEGIAYTGSFDVGLIPFTPGAMNDAINPVKMYMYLAAGIPVVATAVRECVLLPEYVLTASTPEKFAELVNVAINQIGDNPLRIRRSQFAMRNRWKDRAIEALQVMDGCGIL